MLVWKIECKPLNVKDSIAYRLRGAAGVVANHWLIETAKGIYLQSYNTLVAFRSTKGKVTLNYQWDCSQITARYRRHFLEEGKVETVAKIESGEYDLDYLNAREGV